MGDYAIRTENLCVGYSAPIVSDFNISLRAGEILTILGPNGSGKTTLLKTIAGHIKKLGGSVYLGSSDTDTIARTEIARSLSVMLTERIHANLMTCREVVETGRYPYTGYFGKLSKADKAAVTDAIRLVQAEDIEHRSFNQISDGQRQKIILAKAICQQPRVLLLDEPTSFLDIHHKIEFLEILRSLVREKDIAVIMSLHELEFAKEISDHALCLKDGKVYRMGTSDEIFSEEVICELFDISHEMYRRYYERRHL